jgi:hypothetical protein
MLTLLKQHTAVHNRNTFHYKNSANSEESKTTKESALNALMITE